MALSRELESLWPSWEEEKKMEEVKRDHPASRGFK